ncbi:MAG: peptidoglycan-binding protein [Bacteroidales bacterium]|nr:peptidoglycan-binding protein [Clostridium sp.]MCM1203377.1 peptidoglycan-binding protein [Bacteroidales bacterium]
MKAQGYYKGNIDGRYGRKSEEAVKAYQRAEVSCLMADGEITAKQATWKKLLNLI